MANEVENYPVEIVELPARSSLIDITTEISTGVYRSDKMKVGVNAGVEVIAYKTGVNTQATGIIALDWNCSEMSVIPAFLEIINTASGKALGNVQIKLQKDSGDGDIILPELLSNFQAFFRYRIPVYGLIPELLSDSDIINLEILAGSTGSTTCDFRLYGTAYDV